MFLTGSSFVLLRWYASFYARLMSSDLSDQALRRAVRRGLLSPALYLVGTLAAFELPALSLAIQVLVPIIFFLPAATEPGRDDQDRELRSER